MNKQTNVLLIAVLVGAAVGAVVVSRLFSNEPSKRQSPTDASQSSEQVFVNDPNRFEPSQLASVLESLTNTLNEEISERRLLTQQIQQLQADVEQLQAEHRDSDERGAAERMASSQAREKRFAEVGFTWEDIEAIAPLLSEIQVLAGELDDRARREGWINTARYAEEIDALSTFENPLRDELGDDGFDRYLYAIGRHNRVVVGGIIPASEARKAGFQSGDVIVRYGGEPVYSKWHLVRLRSSGEAGEPVVVEINRDGQPMQITIPRGPMGFGGSEENINPNTNTKD
jgi:hypothetical protein